MQAKADLHPKSAFTKFKNWNWYIIINQFLIQIVQCFLGSGLYARWVRGCAGTRGMPGKSQDWGQAKVNGQKKKDNIMAPMRGNNEGTGEEEKSQWLEESRDFEEEDWTWDVIFIAFLEHLSSAPQFSHNPLWAQVMQTHFHISKRD